jgi:hypothetical protein
MIIINHNKKHIPKHKLKTTSYPPKESMGKGLLVSRRTPSLFARRLTTTYESTQKVSNLFRRVVFATALGIKPVWEVDGGP